MEGHTLIALMMCCCFAAVESSSLDSNRWKRTAGESAASSTGSLLKPGYKIITELPKPEPGFYLNRQFEKQRAANGGMQKAVSASASDMKLAEISGHEPGFFLNRQFQKDAAPENNARNDPEMVQKVVDASGRYWVVSEPAQPEPGFYLNRQFQKSRHNKKTVHSGSDGDNVVFLVKKNHKDNHKEIVPDKQVSEQTVPKPQPNIYTILSTRAGARDVPVQQIQTQEIQRPVTTQSVPSPATRGSGSPSFIVRQMLRNKQASAGSSATTGKEKKASSTIADQPEVQPPSQLQPISQGKGFSCEGKPFGYYGDLESNCQQYHICNPVAFNGGSVQHFKYSFHCSVGSRWDSVHKVCAPIATASPCQ